MSQLSELVTGFVERLSAAIEADVMARVRSNVEASLGINPRRGRLPAVFAMGAPGRQRRKAPIQLCPVPGCKNRAAPVFGMVCSDHKNIAKSTIKKYREARKEAKTGGKPAEAQKQPKRRKARKTRAAAKPARATQNAKPATRRAPGSKRATRRNAPARRPPATPPAAVSASPPASLPATA